jgi:hypothetical protein
MSSDATPVSSQEGLRFDQPDANPGATSCARCRSAITTRYYEVNGHVVCWKCKSELARGAEGSAAGRLVRASGYGLGGAVVGAGIYYAILALTGYEIGLVAIAVGWLVGRGVQKGSGGAGGWAYQTIAVALTYLAIVSTYVPFIMKSALQPDSTVASADSARLHTAARSQPAAVERAASADSVTVQSAAATLPSRPAPDSARRPMTAGRLVLGLLALILIAAAAPFLAGIQNIIGLVIIGFALYQAWQMNRRATLVINGPFAVAGSADASRGE